jgi:hypothetical protein
MSLNIITKTKLSVIIFAFFSMNMSAQITVTDTDVLNIGDVIYEATDMLSVGLNPGNSGANQTWDFSALQNNMLDTITVLNPNSTPYVALHPDADVSIFMDSSFLYMSKDNNELSIVGFDSVSVYMPFSPLPLTYGLQSSKSYVSFDSIASLPPSLCQLYFGVPCDSIYFMQKADVIWEVDAFGDVILPSGSYSSLRLKRLELASDSVYYHLNGVWYADTSNSAPADTSVLYSWWTNDPSMHFRIVEMDYTDDYSDEVIFLAQVQTTNSVKDLKSSILVYPNPAFSEIMVNAQNNELTNLEFLDLNGKLILKKEFTQSTSLDVSHIAKGMYYLNLKTVEGNLTKQIIIE